MDTTQSPLQTTDIHKNDREVLRIRTKEFQGKEYVDLRIWYEAQGDDNKGKPRPTKKGVTFRRDLLPDVLRALEGLAAVGPRVDGHGDLERETGQESCPWKGD